MTSDPEVKFIEFGKCVTETQLLMKDRVIAFLYYRAKISNAGSTVEELVRDFEKLGLAAPQARRIRWVLKKDRRTISVGKDAWKLKSDETKWLDSDLEECITGTPKVT